MRKKIFGRVCPQCKKELDPRRPCNAVFCSKMCSREKNRKVKGSWSASRKADRGAMSELIAAADLLEKGYEVYRNVSPHGSADLMIRQNDHVLSVEVRTGRQNGSGKIVCAETRMRSDVLAVVFKNRVHYKIFAEKAGLGFSLRNAANNT